MIRMATFADTQGIAHVLKESYNISSVEEGSSVFLEESSKGIMFLVAVEGEKIVGLTTLKFHGLPKHGLFELERIAVLPDVQGKGVAKQLFDALIAEAKKWYSDHGHKARKLIILTHDDNSRAQAFYEKMGLKHETTLKDHYYEGTDERVYSLFL